MIDASYFDGINARRHPVKLIMHMGTAAIVGAGINRSLQLARFEVSERLRHAPRILRFPEGGFIETSDHKRLDKMLAQNGYRTPAVVRWQNNWPLSLLALGALVASLVWSYQWGVPLAADRLAQHLPAAINTSMGDQALASMEKYLRPSSLPVAEQARLRGMFGALAQPNGAKTPYRLEFRASQVGPNAFALPNGVIVMTDELVQLAGSDEAVLGVLSHELGHLERRHAGRHLLQGLGVGVVLNLWLGDATSAMAAVPAILLNQKHSRDFEREADGYAIAMMRANGRSLEPMAALFERMGAQAAQAASAAPHADADEEDEEGHEEEQGPTTRQQRKPAPDFLSSHPSDAERIATLRAAGAR